MNEEKTPPPLGTRAPPVGSYRRAVWITAEAGQVAVEMEDDVHHFGVVLRHVGDVVTSVEAKAVRTPYVTCSGAAGQLKTLEGCSTDVIRRLGAAARAEHCLHLYDLAILAAGHVGKRGFERLYRIEVDHDASPPLARIWRDGVEALSWGVDAGFARGSRFDGVAFSDFARHLAASDPDEAEAALVLRRASMISGVRRLDLDTFSGATLRTGGPANCYAKRPARIDQGTRRFGSSRDFWGHGVWPLAGRTSPTSPVKVQPASRGENHSKPELASTPDGYWMSNHLANGRIGE